MARLMMPCLSNGQTDDAVLMRVGLMARLMMLYWSIGQTDDAVLV